MREKYIPAFIMLLAGAVTSIINIVNKTDMVTGLKRLLLVIIIFYFVGLTVRGIYKTALTKYGKKPKTEAAETDSENGDQTDKTQPVNSNSEEKKPDSKMN